MLRRRRSIKDTPLWDRNIERTVACVSTFEHHTLHALKQVLSMYDVVANPKLLIKGGVDIVAGTIQMGHVINVGVGMS